MTYIDERYGAKAFSIGGCLILLGFTFALFAAMTTYPYSSGTMMLILTVLFGLLGFYIVYRSLEDLLTNRLSNDRVKDWS